jgi:hypothetical protein
MTAALQMTSYDALLFWVKMPRLLIRRREPEIEQEPNTICEPDVVPEPEPEPELPEPEPQPESLTPLQRWLGLSTGRESFTMVL